MVIMQLPKNEKKEEMLDSFLEHLNELKAEVSEIRKAGYDTTMVDLMMIDVPSYVKLARVTYEPGDFDRIKKGLAEIRHELDLVKTGTEFEDALEKLHLTFDLYREGKIKEARQKYKELTTVYKSLPEDLRKTLFKASFEIHKKLDEA